MEAGIALSILVFGVILGATRYRVVERHILRVVFYVLLPLTVCNAFLTVPLHWEMMYLPFYGLGLDIVLALIMLALTRRLENRLRGSMVIASSTMNVGIFSIPFLKMFYGDLGIALATIFDIGNSFYVFFVCYLIASYFSGWGYSWRRNILNYLSIPYVWAMLFALSIRSLEIDIPEYLFLLLTPSLLTPYLILVYLGIHLSMSFGKGFKKHLRNLLVLWITKFSVGFIAGYLFGQLMMLEGDVADVVLTLSVLPPAFITMIYSEMMGLDLKYATFAVSTSIMIDIPILFMIAGI
ncbi:MAG TPA: hypothetical protein ENF41_01765 [Candidatus Bathyarchaeota archaeon]|nr:hypothetical protein [Candidatus Bathyarchaeota archaeon]